MSQQLAFLPGVQNAAAWPTFSLSKEIRVGISRGTLPRAIGNAPHATAAGYIPTPATPPQVVQPLPPGNPAALPAPGSYEPPLGPIREMGPNQNGTQPQVIYNPNAANKVEIGEPGGITPAQKPVREMGANQ